MAGWDCWWVLVHEEMGGSSRTSCGECLHWGLVASLPGSAVSGVGGQQGGRPHFTRRNVAQDRYMVRYWFVTEARNLSGMAIAHARLSCTGNLSSDNSPGKRSSSWRTSRDPIRGMVVGRLGVTHVGDGHLPNWMILLFDNDSPVEPFNCTINVKQSGIKEGGTVLVNLGKDWLR